MCPERVKGRPLDVVGDLPSLLGNAVPTTVWPSATRNSASIDPATASTVPHLPDHPSATKRVLIPPANRHQRSPLAHPSLATDP